MPPTHRLVVIAALLAVVASAVTATMLIEPGSPAGTAWGRAPAEVKAVVWPEARPLADVTLRTHNHEPFHTTDLKGQWSLMFFGYLGCPDVCPTSLYAMRRMRERLVKADDEGTQFIFISLDPISGGSAELRDFLATHGPAFIGLHGPETAIDNLTKSMAVKHEVLVDENNVRSIDHTSSVMIIDPSGRMVGALPAPLVPAQMFERFQRLRQYLAG